MAGDRVQRSHEGSRGGAFQLSLEFHSATETFESLKQFVGALIPFLALFAQRLADNLLKLSRSLRDDNSPAAAVPFPESKSLPLLVSRR